MEHMTLPEGVKPFVVVPYYAPKEKDWYDMKGYAGYPRRMGWSDDALLGKESSAAPFGSSVGQPRTDEDIVRFFQTWLYFGTAIEFFKVAGGHVLNTESFIYRVNHPDKAHIVQTTYLRMYLGTIWSKSTRSKEVLWKEATAILSCTLRYLNIFCQEPKERHPSDREKVVTWPLVDEISISITSLVFTLIEAAKLKCGMTRFPKLIIARSSRFHRSLERKWCLADATRFQDELGIDGHYFLAASPGLTANEHDNHHACTRDRCFYNKDDKTYIVKHAPSPWHTSGCESATWGGQFGGDLLIEQNMRAKDWFTSVVNIINHGAIPLILWSTSLKKYFTVEFHTDCESKLTPPYVAISHVWADGKGNPTENSLPRCQIENIHDMVDKIQYEGRRPGSNDTSFWMDTMCVPVGDGYETQRTKAIKSMKTLYASAKAVLVLDDWMREVDSTASPLTLLARIYQSNWTKRLWTHQEGFFPKEVWVQFKDRAIKMEDIAELIRKYEQDMSLKGVYLPWVAAALRKSVSQYAGIKGLYNGVREGPIGNPHANIYQLFSPLIDLMHLRRTSRWGDETICLATIVGLPLDKYTAIASKPDDVAARERMCIFLSEIKKFDSWLVFNAWDRLQKPGFGWAPKTLLSHRGGIEDSELGVSGQANSNPDPDSETGELQHRQGIVVGLLVTYPGFASFDFFGHPRLSIDCGDQAFVIRGGTKGFFVVQVARNDVQWDRINTYGMILSNVPEVDSEESVVAVIGATSRSHGSGIAFRHLCRAHVFLKKSYTRDCLDVVEASLLGDGTKWLVS